MVREPNGKIVEYYWLHFQGMSYHRFSSFYYVTFDV